MFKNCIPIILSLLLAAAASFTSQSLAQEHLILNGSFGVINKSNDGCDVDFSIENPLNETLTIVKSVVSCGCISLSKDAPKSIPAGSSAVFPVHVDTTRTNGKMNQSVVLSTDSDSIRSIRLRVTGTVAGVWVEPTEISAGEIHIGSSAKRNVVVYSAGLPKVKVTEIHCTDKNISYSELNLSTSDKTKSAGAEGVHAVKVEVKPGATVGKHRAILSLTAETKDREFLLQVPITYHVLGQAKVTPSKLVFGSIKKREKTVRKCTIVSKTPSETNSLSVKSADSEVSAVLKVLVDGKIELTVVARNPESSSKRILNGKLEILDKDQVIYEIPYVGFLRPPGPKPR